MKHKINTLRLVLFALILFQAFGVSSVHSQTITTDENGNKYKLLNYEKRFYFKLGKHDIDETMNGNDMAIDSILAKIKELKETDGTKDLKLHITSFASLESSDQYNFELASNRTNSLKTFISKFMLLENVPIITEPNIFDWQTLIKMTDNSDCPFKEEALRIMDGPEFDGTNNIRKSKLEKLGDGVTYEYMRKNFFPLMRNSALTLTASIPTEDNIETGNMDFIPETGEFNEKKYIHLALSTNLLYDAVTLGNVGLDVYLGNHFSAGANWMYTWWKNDKKNWYWRAYGGDVHCDYWFNDEDLWHGHHVGAYAQMLTFDVDLDYTGYLGPKWLYGGGASYGYALGIGRSLTLDMGLGIGYMGGKYYEYIPSDVRNKYLLKKVHHLHWFGPTSAKVSLVWHFDL